MVIDCRRRRHTKHLSRYVVFLNGKEVREVFYTDGRRGVVRAYDVDSGGMKFVKPDTWDVSWTEYRGHVRLRRVA